MDSIFNRIDDLITDLSTSLIPMLNLNLVEAAIMFAGMISACQGT